MAGMGDEGTPTYDSMTWTPAKVRSDKRERALGTRVKDLPLMPSTAVCEGPEWLGGRDGQLLELDAALSSLNQPTQQNCQWSLGPNRFSSLTFGTFASIARLHRGNGTAGCLRSMASSTWSVEAPARQRRLVGWRDRVSTFELRVDLAKLIECPASQDQFGQADGAFRNL
jgi:hypothetical protein